MRARRVRRTRWKDLRSTAPTGELTEINGLSSFAPSFGMFDQSGSYLFTHGVGEIGELGFSSGSLTSNTNTLSTGSNFAWAVTDTH